MTLLTFKEDVLAVCEVVGDLERNRKGVVDGWCLVKCFRNGHSRRPIRSFNFSASVGISEDFHVMMMQTQDGRGIRPSGWKGDEQADV